MFQHRTNRRGFKDAGASVGRVRRSSREFYDHLSRAYDLISNAAERPARDAGVNLLGPKSGERILELGCGTGTVLPNVRRRVGPAGLVCGLDLSWGMLQEARRKVRRGDVSLIHADALRLPFEGHAFDGVYTSFTLEVLSEGDLEGVLREVHRVLRVDGRLGIVALSKGKSGMARGAAERAYAWFHRHFPHIVDCRPLDLDPVLRKFRFRLIRRVELEIWSIPVVAAVAI